jgi:NADPH:quinone reductase-like Zn-dependent oxidoreductase
MSRADEVCDYSRQNFADAAISDGAKFDAAVDYVGGRYIEDKAFRVLRKTGIFATVVGPVKFIGRERLSWPDVIGVIAHVGWRMIETRLTGGTRYTFSAKYPRSGFPYWSWPGPKMAQ